MSTNLKKASVILFVFSIIAGMTFGFSFLVRMVFRWFMDIAHTVSTMDTVIIIAVISGAVTIVGLLVNSIITLRLKQSDYKHTRKMALLRKLEAPYTQFVNMLFDMLQKKEDAGKIDEQIRAQLIRDMSREIILYGSDDVVKKWVEYRKQANDFTIEEHLLYIEGILHLIRKDMGIQQGHLAPGDLLALFVDDVDSLRKDHMHFSLGKANLTLDFDKDKKVGKDE